MENFFIGFLTVAIIIIVLRIIFYAYKTGKSLPTRGPDLSLNDKKDDITTVGITASVMDDDPLDMSRK